jgi:hypothetical protein
MCIWTQIWLSVILQDAGLRRKRFIIEGTDIQTNNLLFEIVCEWISWILIDRLPNAHKLPLGSQSHVAMLRRLHIGPRRTTLRELPWVSEHRRDLVHVCLLVSTRPGPLLYIDAANRKEKETTLINETGLIHEKTY